MTWKKLNASLLRFVIKREARRAPKPKDQKLQKKNFGPKGL